MRSRESGGELGRTRLAARVRFGFRSQSNEKPSLALSRALAWSDLYSAKIICSFWPSGERAVAMKRAWRERAAQQVGQARRGRGERGSRLGRQQSQASR